MLEDDFITTITATASASNTVTVTLMETYENAVADDDFNLLASNQNPYF